MNAKLCHHLMDSGRRCGSPPMKDHYFCYYHNRLHNSYVLPGHSQYVAPDLNHPEAISIYLNHIQIALTKRLLSPKQAEHMLYSIRIAQINNRDRARLTPIVTLPSVTEYTPGMRYVYGLGQQLPEPEDLSHTDSSSNPSTAIASEASEPRVISDVPDDVPYNHLEESHLLCRATGLRPLTEPIPLPDATPAWFPPTPEELDFMRQPPRSGRSIGSAYNQERHRNRRLKLYAIFGDRTDVTPAEIAQAISSIETEERQEKLAVEDRNRILTDFQARREKPMNVIY